MTQPTYRSYESNVETKPQIQVNNDNGFLWKGILIGAAVGGLTALIDKSTRQNVQNRSVKIKDQTSNMFRNVKDDPAVIMSTIRNTMDTTSKTLNNLANEVRDVIRKVDDVRQHSKETYTSFREVGQELKDVSGTVFEAGKELTDMKHDPTDKLNTQ